MADYHPLQSGFTVGEVSSRLALRQGTELYREALLEMVNWQPNPQGTAERTPGTRFDQIIPYTDPTPDTREPMEARVIGFETETNLQALLIITPDEPPLIITDAQTSPAVNNVPVGFSQVVQNPSFREGSNFWEFLPNAPFDPLDPNQGAVAFTQFRTTEDESVAVLVSQNTQNTGFQPLYLRQALVLPEAVQSFDITIGMFLQTLSVIGDLPFDFFGIRLSLSSTPAYDGDLAISEPRYFQTVVGDPFEQNIQQTINITNPTAGPVYISLELIGNTNGQVNDVLAAQAIVDLIEISIPVSGGGSGDPAIVLGGTYSYRELKELQFVQSPYGKANIKPRTDDDEGFRNELILVHPNRPPRWLTFDGTNWNLTKIQFIMQDPSGPTDDDPPVEQPVFDVNDGDLNWSTGNYPAACTSYQGRLVLAGGGQNGEQVLCSVSGDWRNLHNVTQKFQPKPEDVFPANALRFNTIFRSPIRWCSGQQDLLIGTNELEYKVQSSTGLLTPGDIDVRAQTAEGGLAVQPSSVGDAVLFAAARGRKSRKLEFSRDRDSYIAPDMTLFNPFVCESGIRRMVRIRNPHQMVLHVLDNGTVAILHYDMTGLNSEVFGWSRMRTSTGDRYIDVTVLKNADGEDVPVFLVERNIQGAQTLMLEVMPGWVTDRSKWRYVESYDVYAPTGPELSQVQVPHLKGRIVQVITDVNNYIGEFRVGDDENGTIDIVDSDGYPIPFRRAIVGLPKPSTMTLLPPEVDGQSMGGVGSKKRYKEIGLRLRSGRVPLINGERPPSRIVNGPMDQPPALVGVDGKLYNIEVSKLGIDEFQLITISETIPERVEVVGVYGHLTSNKT